jgi:plastocyanin
MPVPPSPAPHSGISIAWIIRFGVLLALVALGLLAILAPQTRSSAPASSSVSPTLAPTPAPPPTLVALATQTPQPITSIIVRETSVVFPTATPALANQPAVSIVDFSYFPGTLRIQAGQSVTWRNDGNEEHDVTGDDWHSGLLDPTYTYRLTFGLPGTYAYRCSIHLDMTGAVIVS